MQPDSKRRKCRDETKEVGEPDSTLQLNVVLPSGRCAALSLPLNRWHRSWSENGCAAVFEACFPNGRLLDPTEPLQVSGLRSGDSTTAVAQKLKGTAKKGTLALWCVGGNRIVTWGRSIKEATVRWSKISSRTFSRSIQQSVRLLQSWQMAALWHGAIPAAVATAPESLTNWGMFSRSMLQSARLLQFWQMAALWRGAIPTGGEQQHSQRSVQIFVANCGIIFAANKLLHVTYSYQDVRHLTAWKWRCRRNEGWCCGLSWVFALNRRDQFIYADAFKPPTGGRPWLAVRSVFFT